ncbi:tetratricopeptide repeat protein, partial [candidate division WOR-3 bacterium]|nr:tetratricopeptide repeat protein [candidate division WOR-3 bacterium]
YLSQLFYPVPTRLSIEHDINVSSSIFHPWTTLPAILIIFSLIGLGLSQMRKRPILSFAILFFFLNHLIESTVIGLELAFEHRNYLPSLFLFLPVSIGIKHLLDYYYSNKKVSMFYILVSFFILLIIGLGSGTYIRNMAWATEKSLWEDAIQKAAESSRPLHNLAWGYYERIGRYDKAMELYKKAGKLKVHSTSLKSLILNNMATIYYISGDYRKAAELWRKAADTYPKYEATQYRLALALTKLGDWEKALDHLDTIISKCPEHCDYLNLKGLVLLKQKRPEEALPYLRSALRLSPNNNRVIVSIGVALSLLGKHNRAEWFLSRANRISPTDIVIFFCLIENSLRGGDISGANQYLERLFASAIIKSIRTELEGLLNDNSLVPVSQELLAPVIADKLMEKSNEIAELG